MFEIFGVPAQLLYVQLTLGIVYGSFYALLSLGLAVIFGVMNVANFAHGAQYMLGAVVAYLLLTYVGLGYWSALFISPAVVGILGMATERVLLRRIQKLDHLYGMLVTFGLALVIQGLTRYWLGSSGIPYEAPAELQGSLNLGFMDLPLYRVWVLGFSLIICLTAWLVVERTKLGAYLRAGTENPIIVQAFGINVPLLITLTYGGGTALAALAGVMAAPIFQVSPLMGSDLIIVVFAVVVIGGMGSIIGSIVTGFSVGAIEGVTRTFYPEASNTVIFVIMVVVLVLRPAGLFGKIMESTIQSHELVEQVAPKSPRSEQIAIGLMLLLLILAPFFFFSVFLMNAVLVALFACAFNLLAGYGRIISFGHAMFFGGAGYVSAYTAKAWGFPPELAILAGTLTALGLSVVSGYLALRRQGIYFAMITLALAQMVYFSALEAPFTGGENGIQSVPRGMMFGLLNLSNDLTMYWVCLAVFMFGFLLVRRIIRSPFGYILMAIRDHEPRATSLGFTTNNYKFLAYVISGTLAGLAGATKVIALQLASLSDVYWGTSGEVLLMTFLGGVGTLFGPVVGAFLVVAMETYLAGIGSWVTVIQGALFIAIVLMFRRGIVGELERSWNAWQHQNSMVFSLFAPGKHH